jgi:hypothetical protein
MAVANRRWTDSDFRDFKASRRTGLSYLIPAVGIGTVVAIIAGLIIIVNNNRKNKENEV